jgi:HD-like signal output (HDOD) protein
MHKDYEKLLLKKQIMETSSLPAPPIYLSKLMSLLLLEEVDVKELVDTLERDQSLVAQVLKLVNSGYYGLRHTVESVFHAVNLLGLKNIKHVVYAASMMNVFKKEEQAEWEHSYSCSVLMNKILNENDLPVAKNLGLTALLHDIGKVVLRRWRPHKYEFVMQQFKNIGSKVPFHSIEKQVFKSCHAEVGGWLMEKWMMTDDIIYPVQNHHTVIVPEKYPLETALVQLVDWIDKQARDYPTTAISRELMFSVGIEEIDYQYWIQVQKELLESIKVPSAGSAA